MTPRDDQERAILLYIDSYTKANGAPPTLKEIGQEVGVVKSQAFHYVNALMGQGLLFRKPHAARMLTITEAGRLAIAKIKADAKAEAEAIASKLMKEAVNG